MTARFQSSHKLYTDTYVPFLDSRLAQDLPETAKVMHDCGSKATVRQVFPISILTCLFITYSFCREMFHEQDTHNNQYRPICHK